MDPAASLRPVRPPRRGLIVVATVLSGLLGSATSQAAAATDVRPAIEDVDITLASLNISLFALEHLDAPTNIAAPCPLLLPDQLGFFLGQQSIAATTNGWSVSLFREDGVGDGVTGVQCGVDIESAVAAPDPAAPNAAVIDAFPLLDPAQFTDYVASKPNMQAIGPGAPEIGGTISGLCGSIGGQPVCLLAWNRGELVVELGIGGPAVTQDAAVATMNAMIPTVVESLTNYSAQAGGTTVPGATTAPVPVPPTTQPQGTTVSQPPVTTLPTAVTATTAATATTAPATAVTVSVPPLTTAAPATTTVGGAGLDIAGAKATLADFIANNPVGTEVVFGPGVTPACPALGPEPLAAAMQQLGLQPNIDEFIVGVHDRTDWAAGIQYVSCGANTGAAAAGIDPARPPHYASIEFYDITGRFTWEQVLALMPNAIPADVPQLGGQIAGACSSITTSTFCPMHWHLDGLIVRLSVVGPEGSVNDTVTRQLLTSLVPQAVSDLATHASWPPAPG